MLGPTTIGLNMTESETILSAVKHISIDELKTLPFFQSRGRRFIPRALVDDVQGHKELAFSNAIKRYHERLITDGLAGIIESDSEEELEAAFTLFQWLATNVGSGMLDEALKAIGKKVVDINPAPHPSTRVTHKGNSFDE